MACFNVLFNIQLPRPIFFIYPSSSFKFITHFASKLSGTFTKKSKQKKKSGILSFFDLLQKIMPSAYKNDISFLHIQTTECLNIFLSSELA